MERYTNHEESKAKPSAIIVACVDCYWQTRVAFDPLFIKDAMEIADGLAEMHEQDFDHRVGTFKDVPLP